MLNEMNTNPFLVLPIVMVVNGSFIMSYLKMNSAIEREKQIKAGSRKKKIALIEKMNPSWNDLYNTLL